MARIRSVKPEFWKSEAIAALSWEARLGFIALWSYVDDNGVGRDNVKLVAAELFALEDDPTATLAKVSSILDELARESRIVRYTNAGKAYLCIVNWDEHQKIDRPNKARYPQPDDAGSTLLTCGNLNPRESPAEPARDVRESPSPGAVELGNRGTEEQGRPPAAGATSAPAAQDALDVPEPERRPKTVNQLAQDLATRYRELVPLSKFPAVMRIAKQALDADYALDDIAAALERLAEEGRPLTVDVLRVELEGLPTRRTPASSVRLDPSQQDYSRARI